MEKFVDAEQTPEGFVAVKSRDGCSSCYFLNKGLCPRNSSGKLFCISENRIDKHDVIFIQDYGDKNEPKKLEYFDGTTWRVVSDNEVREQIEHGLWVRNYKNKELVIARSINTLFVFDVDVVKKNNDDGVIANGYTPVGDWFFIKNETQ